jgi:hypothetical protein
MLYGIQERNSNTESINVKFAACFLVVSTGVWSATQADEPPSRAAQPPATQAPAPATPAPKAEKSEVVNAPATEAEINKMRSRGYKTVNRNGKLTFCRDEGTIGTNFQRTQCSTLDQLRAAEPNSQESAKSMQKHGSPIKGL